MAGVITALLAATSALTATGGLPGVGGRLSLVRASRRYASGGGVRLRAEDDWPDAPPQSYGEESRKYRRTVYAHADWLRHRSSSRLFRGLRTMFISGVVRALWLEVFTIFAVSTGLVAWNHQGALGHLSLLPAWAQCLQLPVLPFNLSSPVLGLLLVFRTNTSYARWLEARIIWGRVAAHASNMLRQAIAWTERADAGGSPRTAERMGELDGLALSLRLFQRALCAAMRGVEYAAEFRSWVRLNLEPADSMRLLRAAPAERPWVALSIVTCHLEQMKMDPKRAVEIDKSEALPTLATWGARRGGPLHALSLALWRSGSLALCPVPCTSSLAVPPSPARARACARALSSAHSRSRLALTRFAPIPVRGRAQVSCCSRSARSRASASSRPRFPSSTRG